MSVDSYVYKGRLTLLAAPDIERVRLIQSGCKTYLTFQVVNVMAVEDGIGIALRAFVGPAIVSPDGYEAITEQCGAQD